MPKIMIEVDTADEASVAAAVAYLMSRVVGEPAKPTAAEKKAAKAAEKKAAEAAAEPDETDETPPSVSREEVRAQLKEYMALENKDAAIAILTKTGEASSVGELDEAHFQAVYDETGKAIAAKKAADAEDI